MFIHKTRLGVALLITLGGFYALAQTLKVAPLTAKESKLTHCPLHHTPLQLGTAIILYGRRANIVPQLIAIRQFPRASTHRMGGCVVSTNSPTQRQVKFCPPCRAAESHWLKSNNRSLPPR